MKRSEINAIIKEMEKMVDEFKFAIPPFCKWSLDEWKSKNEEFNEIKDNKLGWDITDYGLGKFEEVGFSIITLRNGNLNNDKYKKPYAEKLLMLKPGQSAPMHFHFSKMEDIINRGGGDVFITVYNSNKDGSFDSSPVTVYKDGRKYTVEAGSRVKLSPGESITIQQFLYHDFYVEKDSSAVLLGEVSMCNDDDNDNRFYEPIGRFPEIEEDEEPYKLLCIDYDKFLK